MDKCWSGGPNNTITTYGNFMDFWPKPKPEKLYWCKFKDSQGYLFESDLKNKEMYNKLGFVKILWEKEEENE